MQEADEGRQAHEIGHAAGAGLAPGRARSGPPRRCCTRRSARANPAAAHRWAKPRWPTETARGCSRSRTIWRSRQRDRALHAVANLTPEARIARCRLRQVALEPVDEAQAAQAVPAATKQAATSAATPKARPGMFSRPSKAQPAKAPSAPARMASSRRATKRLKRPAPSQSTNIRPTAQPRARSAGSRRHAPSRSDGRTAQAPAPRAGA